MSKPKLPTVIKVAGLEVQLQSWNPDVANAERCFGKFMDAETKMYVDINQPPTRIAGVLLHELLHAVYNIYGLEDSDEQERIVHVLYL